MACPSIGHERWPVAAWRIPSRMVRGSHARGRQNLVEGDQVDPPWALGVAPRCPWISSEATIRVPPTRSSVERIDPEAVTGRAVASLAVVEAKATLSVQVIDQRGACSS